VENVEVPRLTACLAGIKAKFQLTSFAVPDAACEIDQSWMSRIDRVETRKQPSFRPNRI
jgi:hypothetical protein